MAQDSQHTTIAKRLWQQKQKNQQKTLNKNVKRTKTHCFWICDTTLQIENLHRSLFSTPLSSSQRSQKWSRCACVKAILSCCQRYISPCQQFAWASFSMTVCPCILWSKSQSHISMLHMLLCLILPDKELRWCLKPMKNQEFGLLCWCVGHLAFCFEIWANGAAN